MITNPDAWNPRAPKLLRCETIVYGCAACKRMYDHVPAFLGDILDKGDSCIYCGNSSFISRPGRPFGPKYKHWANILIDWEMLYETLRTTPDFAELLATVTYKKVIP